MDDFKIVRCAKCRKIITEMVHGKIRIRCKCGHINLIHINISPLTKTEHNKVGLT